MTRATIFYVRDNLGTLQLRLVWQVLMDMLSQNDSTEAGAEEPPLKGDVTLTYDQLVKDLLEHEKAFIRELNMISKVPGK